MWYPPFLVKPRSDYVVSLSQCREVIQNSKEVLSLLQEKTPTFKPVLAIIQVSWECGSVFLFYDVFFFFFLAILSLRCHAWTFSSCDVWASHCHGFSCCGARALDACIQSVHGLLWHMGLVALRHVESSGPRIELVSPVLADRLYHWTTREVPVSFNLDCTQTSTCISHHRHATGA